MKSKSKKLIEVLLQKPLNIEDISDKKCWLKYNQWKSQFSKIAHILTNKSGFWYVGTGIDKIAKQIENLTPEQLKDFRSKVADLELKSRSAEKALNDVKASARALIKLVGGERNE